MNAPNNITLASNLQTPCFTFQSEVSHTGRNQTIAKKYAGKGTWAIVVFEGFDADDNIEPSTYYNLVNGLMSNVKEAPDIWVINYGWGGASIKECLVPAAKDLLIQINQHYTKGVPKLPISVLGISMGGIVGRIALAQLEAENKLPNVVSFLFMDSPQSGATGNVNVNLT